MLQLPDIGTNAGVVARLIIAECQNPGYATYNRDDGLFSFRLMQATVDNRLNNNPGQFGAPNAATYTDIVTAPGQFAGFSLDDNGNLSISQSILDRITTVLANANNGTPGEYYTFVQDIITRVNSPIDDPMANVTSIDGVGVVGGTYAWRTLNSGSPGGRFVAFSVPLRGVLLNNQFYGLMPPAAESQSLWNRLLLSLGLRKA